MGRIFVAGGLIFAPDGVGMAKKCFCPVKITIHNATCSFNTTMHFAVTLDRPSPCVVTVDFGTMQGTASAGHLDYVGVPATPPTTLTFAPGVTTLNADISILSRTFSSVTYDGPYTPANPGVYFYVLLANPVNATISIGTGIGTITN